MDALHVSLSVWMKIQSSKFYFLRPKRGKNSNLQKEKGGVVGGELKKDRASKHIYIVIIS